MIFFFFPNTHYHKHITSKVKIKGLNVSLNLIATDVCVSCQGSTDRQEKAPEHWLTAHGAQAPGQTCSQHQVSPGLQSSDKGTREAWGKGKGTLHPNGHQVSLTLWSTMSRTINALQPLSRAPTWGRNRAKRAKKWTSHHPEAAF